MIVDFVVVAVYDDPSVGLSHAPFWLDDLGLDSNDYESEEDFRSVVETFKEKLSEAFKAIGHEHVEIELKDERCQNITLGG